MTVTGTPGRTVRLLAYTRPSTTYAVVRTLVLGPDGTATTSVRPPRNTRLYAADGDAAGASAVLTVASRVDLAVRRDAARVYTFSGRVSPARAGQLVTVARSGGGAVTTARTRADGSWQVQRRFLGTAVLDLVARTPADLQNAAGLSGVRRTTVR